MLTASSPSTDCVPVHLEQGATNELTEANLRLHTLAQSNGRQKRCARVNAYVESQSAIARLEAELQHQRQHEIRTMVPLDAWNAEETVIVEPQASRRDVRQDTHHGMQSTERRSTWFQKLTCMFVRRMPDRPTHHHQQQQHQQQQPQQRQCRRSPPLPSLPLPTGEEKLDPSVTYSHYCKEKDTLIHHYRLSGLSNISIPLGMSPGEHNNIHSALFSNPESLPDTCYAKPQTQQPKRDSGISFLSFMTSSRTSTDKSSRFSLAFRRSHDTDDVNDLVAFRYPKMAPLDSLRCPAGEVLSSDLVHDDDHACEQTQSSRSFSKYGS